VNLIIAQINAQRSAAAAADLEILIQERKIDMLCVQEPYAFRGVVRGYTSQGMTIVQPMVDNPWVAIVVTNEQLEVFHLAQYDTPHIMCLQITSNREEFYIINIYCQFMLPVEPFMDQLEKIIRNLHHSSYIIVMDSNARSSLWFSSETDARGNVVEEFLIHNKVYVVNSPSELPTYFTTNGQSNIDVTLASRGMYKKCVNWAVSAACTTSDHNLISFEVREDSVPNRKVINHANYNIKKANWDGFYQQLEKAFTQDTLDKLRHKNPHTAAENFDKLLRGCCDKAIPKKRCSNGALPWWNKELKQLRQETYSAKKHLARTRRLHLVDYLEDAKIRYAMSRNKYIAAIRTSKRESWQNFVKIEANKDPWSIPYKIVRDKIRKNEVMSSLIVEDGSSTKTWTESMIALFNKCVPRDDNSQETRHHKTILRDIQTYRNLNVEHEITVEEVSDAIKRLKINSAPGHDGFQSEIIREVWKKAPLTIYYLLNNCMRNCTFPNIWKISQLKIILKNKNKNKQSLGSYRPISLLPTISKVLERIILNRIQLTYKDSGLSSNKQYGFKIGKSTEDAILHFKNSVNSTSKKYVVALFIDIQGAFDNL